jgi:hypothetical protein
MHWPKDTRLGDTWECWRCGEIWTWSRNGTNHMTETRSKAPPPAVPAPMPVPQQPQLSPVAPFQQQPPRPVGCFMLVVAIVTAGFGWLLRGGEPCKN